MNKADIGPKTMDAIKRLNATTPQPDRKHYSLMVYDAAVTKALR